MVDIMSSCSIVATEGETSHQRFSLLPQEAAVPGCSSCTTTPSTHSLTLLLNSASTPASLQKWLAPSTFLHLKFALFCDTNAFIFLHQASSFVDEVNMSLVPKMTNVGLWSRFCGWWSVWWRQKDRLVVERERKLDKGGRRGEMSR